MTAAPPGAPTGRTSGPVAGEETEAVRRARVAAEAAVEKNGSDVAVVRVGEILAITEVFVIASASNTRLVKTIVDEVERALAEHDGSRPRSREGLGDASWVLLDYGDIVVHVFLEETRAYYDLDRLWADAPTVPLASSSLQD